jgi:hypothetical protein
MFFSGFSFDSYYYRQIFFHRSVSPYPDILSSPPLAFLITISRNYTIYSKRWELLQNLFHLYNFFSNLNIAWMMNIILCVCVCAYFVISNRTILDLFSIHVLFKSVIHTFWILFVILYIQITCMSVCIYK